MKPVLHVYRDEPLDGPTNMARDEQLLHDPNITPAALRIYAWSPPTISLGYFQRFTDIGKLPEDVRDLAVVRRQTGGGAILHDREITYCLVVDQCLPIAGQAPDVLYKLAHNAWSDAIGVTNADVEMAPDDFPMPSPRTGPFFCFQKPGKTDLIVGNDKLLGSAQRRVPKTKTDSSAAGRVLQHGSLLLTQRFKSHPGFDLGDPPIETVNQWVDSFIANVAKSLELPASDAEWTESQLADAAERRQRYAGDEWTRMR